MLKVKTFEFSHADGHTKTIGLDVGCRIIKMTLVQHVEGAGQNIGISISMDYQMTSITDLTYPEKVLWRYSAFKSLIYAERKFYGVVVASGNLYAYCDFDNATSVYITISYEV